MTAPRTHKRIPAVVAGLVFLVLVLLPHVAGAQQPYTPGATPEPAKEWTYYISWLVAPASIGLVLLIGLTYVRFSGRFFAKEEAPPAEKRRRPRYPIGTSAPPVGPRVEQAGAASTTPPAAPASEVKTAKEQEPQPSTAPERQAAAPKVEATPAATAPAEAPAEKSAGTAPRDEPAGENGTPAQAAPAQAAAPAPAAAPEHVEPDQEAYEKELQAQLDKGTDRRVAEGRAKAATIRAARAKASAPAEAPAPATVADQEHTPRIPATAEQPTPEEQRPMSDVPKEEQKESAEASAQAQAEVKEPERVIDAPTPAADAKEGGAPREVDAPPAEPQRTAEPSAGDRPSAPPGGDEETFNRVLEEQLGKGLARPIAESRARAAAIKAAREKSGG
ncbi:MAG: hypothetical protein ACRDH9_07775 [Actinomycetota bacterium]